MSKYEEICQASENAVRKWNQYRDRSWDYLATIVHGLITQCGVPEEKITFLRSNGLPGEERIYSLPEAGTGQFTLPGAVTYDKEDEYWHLGVAITLSRAGTFPERWVGIVLCVTENDGQAVVKLGIDGTPRPIDFNNPKQCTELYDEIVEYLKGLFENPRKITRQIGFATVVNPQQGQKDEKPAAAER
jgi:hypothetical protein